MKEQAIEASEITGFLDEGTDIKGELKFSGTMRIDGKFNGTILSKGTLIVGEAALIKAEIVEVGTISINGLVEGKVVAGERVEIHAKGRMVGSIQTPSLVIDDGAILQGSCEMEKKPQIKPQTESRTQKVN